MNQNLSNALFRACDQANAFAEDLQRSMLGELHDSWGCITPERLVAQALDLNGGIICAPISYLAYVSPRSQDLLALDGLGRAIRAISDIARAVAQKLGIPLSYLRRFGFRPDELFARDFFERRAQRYAVRCADYRRRIVASVCRAVRAFLNWLRSAFCKLPNGGVCQPSDSIVIALPRRLLVNICDRRRGLVVLLHPSGVGSRCFEVSPGRAKVWAILKSLVEVDTPDGDVKLPENYAAQFHTTNSENEGCADDLSRLVRHIWPSQLHRGQYHLAWDVKPELRRL